MKAAQYLGIPFSQLGRTPSWQVNWAIAAVSAEVWAENERVAMMMKLTLGGR